MLAFTNFVFIWNLVSFEAPGPFDAQATSAYSALISYFSSKKLYRQIYISNCLILLILINKKI